MKRMFLARVRKRAPSWGVEVMNDQVNFYFLFAQEEGSLYLTLPRGIMIDVLRL